MTWSEQTGISLVVPSDRVEGDGRNYIVIGEDVPPEIASQMTAGLVFHSGRPDLDAYGFNYWALGITKTGALEVVAYFYQWIGDPTAGGREITFRRSVLSFSPPSGTDRPTVIALGPTVNYSTFNEGTSRIVSQDQLYPSYDFDGVDIADAGLLAPGFGPWVDDQYAHLRMFLLPTGMIVVNGLAICTGTNFTVRNGLTKIFSYTGDYVPQYYPGHGMWSVINGNVNEGARLFTAMDDGIYLRGAAPAFNQYISINAVYPSKRRFFG